MGLMPLEFKDCLTDSPYFREKLHAHEKELDQTNAAIKALTKEVKEVIQAARNLSKAQRSLSNNLQRFKFECIGNSQTDDEIVIGGSLKEFAKIVDMVEDERERMLDRSYEQIIGPLESFRKEAIGGAKEGRKKFEKQTQKFCQSQERYLNLSTKKDGQVLQEADASVEMEQRHFVQASLEYVFLLQEVQERKKFEFVETLLSHMYGWLTFYHQGHEVHNDCNPYMKDLQVRVQRTRENFQSTREETVQLKNKMLEVRQMSVDPGSLDKMYTRQGYLFLMEKKAFGTTWTKHYCLYQKENRVFTMIPYNQIQHKITSTETIVLKSCVRRMSDTIDKRFCFDLTAQDKPGVQYTLQALSEEDRKHWMDAMDGKEPMYSHPTGGINQEETALDEHGLGFISKAIAMLEGRGLEDHGLYRLVGVASKVSKLLALGLDRRKADKLMLEDPTEWEVKTITSAVKQYFRNLPEPLMTFKLHSAFIAAAKQDRLFQRVNEIHVLVHKLPKLHFKALKTLIQHLVNVSCKSEKNLMTVSNLGVCFGPTLLRPEEETVAAIMDIKFCNIVVEILIEHYDKIFNTVPEAVVEVPRSGDVRGGTPPRSEVNHTSGLAHLQHKQSQPVLQKVVTSFTTSEPQTVHYPTSSLQQLPRLEGTSNLKPGSGLYANVPPPPPSQTHHWTSHSASMTSLNSGLTSAHNSHSSLVSLSGRDIDTSSLYGSVARRSERSSTQPANGQQLNARALSFVNPLSGPLKPSHHGVGGLSEGSGGGIQSTTSSSSESLSSRSSRELSLSSSPKSMRLGTAYPPTYRQHMETRVRTLYACVGENESELSFEPNQILTNVRPSREPGWLEGMLNGRTGLVPENYVEIIDDTPPPPRLISNRNTDV